MFTPTVDARRLAAQREARLAHEIKFPKPTKAAKSKLVNDHGELKRDRVLRYLTEARPAWLTANQCDYLDAQEMGDDLFRDTSQILSNLLKEGLVKARPGGVSDSGKPCTLYTVA